MQRKSIPTDVEQQINRLLTRQFGQVSRRQLLELGLGAEAIRHRVSTGRLSRVRRGVYGVSGAPPTREGRWMAAVLACGDDAVLSHLSAAALWRLTERDPAVIDTSLPGRSRRLHEGLRVHRPRHLDPEDCTRRTGIPVTTVARTLIDLAEVVGSRSLERLLDEAEYLGLLDQRELAEALERNHTRSGAARLRATLGRHEPGTTRTRSPLEEAFLRLTRKAELPAPEVNEPLGPYKIDFLWRAQRVAVETDGRRSHDRSAQRERDSARDAWLTANGYRPLRFTWQQVNQRPEEVLAALRTAL